MEELVVFCINCEKLVSSSDIAKHSDECVEGVKDENQSESNVDLKLKNYRNALKDYLKSKKMDKKIRHVIKSCILKSREAEIECEDLNVFLKIVNRLDKFLIEFDSVVVEVLVGRLRGIIEEKGLGLIEKDKKEGCLIGVDMEITSRQELNCVPSEFFKCEKVELDEWDSFTIGTTEAERSYFIETERDEYKEADSDRLFQYFLSVGLMCRLDFTYKHPAQNYSLKKLYYESKKLGIQIENWQEFITNEFNNLDMHKVYN